MCGMVRQMRNVTEKEILEASLGEDCRTGAV